MEAQVDRVYYELENQRTLEITKRITVYKVRCTERLVYSLTAVDESGRLDFTRL